MMTRRSFAILLLLASIAGVADAGPVKVSGRVVLADGKPAVGLHVSTQWEQTKGEMVPYDGASTDADGRFTIPVDFFSWHSRTLMAMDEAGLVGGVVVVEAEKANRPVEIKAGPLVRVVMNFTSDDPAYPLVEVAGEVQVGAEGVRFAESNTFKMSEQRIGQEMPTNPTGPVEFRLPPGDYVLKARMPYEIPTHQRLSRPITVQANPPGGVQDLGSIAMELNPLVRLYGKTSPKLAIKDARGLPKGVKLADLEGKYVLLEFWATWCGPCVRRIPELVEIYDEHEADRDKFVILAVHGQGADDFADLDKKLAPIVRDVWQGRNLPFPILLDDDGKTFAAFGIESIPATILIDPDGKVVEGGAGALRSLLPEIPFARKLAHAYDRQIAIALGPEGAPLGGILELVCGQAGIEVKPNIFAMAKARVKFGSNVPLTITGQVSLRSWLDLILAPMDLIAVPGPGGLIVTSPDPSKPSEPPSAPQVRCAERIGKKLAAKTRFDFTDARLADVAMHFEQETVENFVLDPKDRLAGRLDPEMKVTGKADGVPLGEALKALLGPLGIEAVVRDEVVILARIRP